MLKPDLQIALGLETVHTEVLRKLNKQNDPGGFQEIRSVFLHSMTYCQGHLFC